jgi:Protein of unknown function (DUF3352)
MAAPARLRAAMRRLLALAVVLAGLLIAGCGGGDDSGSSLDSALAFLPKDTTFAMAVDTDVDGDQYKAAGELIDKFPFGDQIKSSLRQQFQRLGEDVDFDDDVKPILGNPAVFGATDAEALTANSGNFVLAFQAKDQGKLEDLVDRQNPRKVGEESGATIYDDDGTAFAIKDDLFVVAKDETELKGALERADGDDHFDEDSFDEALDGLPGSALGRVYVDVEALLKSDPGSVDARKVKWIGALRTLGLTARARNDAVDVDFRLRTEGDLSEEDLPIASGDDAPPVIKREGEVGLGIRDLAHIVRFAENAGQAIDPAGFGDYEQAKKTIDSQLDVSLDDDLVGQMTGNVAASVAIDGGFGVRAELKDPAAFRRTLVKVADVLPSFAEGAGFGTVVLSKPGAGEDFYELAQPDGDSVIFGVVGDVLVVASDARRAGELANAEPTSVEGAKGSVVVGADAEQLVNTLLGEFGPALGIPDLGGFGTGLLTRPLEDLNGYVNSSTDELRGKFTLNVEN